MRPTHSFADYRFLIFLKRRVTRRRRDRRVQAIQSLRDGAGPVRQGRRHPRPRHGHPRVAAVADPRTPVRHPGPDGRRQGEGVPRLPRAAQRRPRPEQGRHPLPPARDARHRARAGDVDDVEVRRGGHPAGRRQGRRHLRPAPPEHARAGRHLPRLDAPDGQERRLPAGRAGARRDDQPAAHAVDDGRARGDPRPQGAGLHHRQARGHGRVARPHRGDRLRRRSTPSARR